MSVEVSPIELEVQSVLDLRQRAEGWPGPSAEIVSKIKGIRELCEAADKQDILPNGGVLGWRRGTQPHGSSGGYGHGHGHGHNTNHRSGGNLPNRWRGQQGVKPPAPRQQPQSPQERAQNRYISKFQNTDTPVEDKILNQVILNKLNKFSAANYDDVKAFLQQILDSDEKEFLRDFMLLVFKKAASEPTFCPLYARMIGELSESYVSLRSELENLYTRYLTIFEEVSESECKDYNQFVQRNREKIHRLGYSQFLAELTSRGVLTQDQIQQLFTTILQQVKNCSAQGAEKQHHVEEYTDCLLRMCKAFQGAKSAGLVAIRQGLAATCDPFITEMLANRTSLYPGVSKKAQFTLMDCLDVFRGSK